MASTLVSVLRRVLSVGNKEMNQHYPPHVYEEHFQIATDFIIDECVRLFPTNQSIVDVIRPFLAVKFDALKDGSIELPADYRNLLGVSINVRGGGKAPCDCERKKIVDCLGDKRRQYEDVLAYEDDPLGITPEEFKSALRKAGCEANDVLMLDADEFNYRTRHSFKKKRISLENPIGKMVGRSEIKVCPADVSHAEVFYVRKPKEYRFGYVLRPDDTYEFDKANATESEWDDTAFQYLFKAINSLYAIYTRDGEMRDWSLELKRIGLF